MLLSKGALVAYKQNQKVTGLIIDVIHYAYYSEYLVHWNPHSEYLSESCWCSEKILCVLS